MPADAITIPFPYTAEVTVERYLDRVKIDRFLVRHFRNYTRPRMQRLVRSGQVWIDDVPAQSRFRVRTGQRVRVRLIEPPDQLIDAENLPLDVLYEDTNLIVVNKPPGQSAHPGGNYHRGTLANALQYHLDCQTPLPGLLRPGIVHRLDRLTSGVIVACKDHHSHRRLSFSFQNGRVGKTYFALVHGHVAADCVTIDLPIGRLPGKSRMGTEPSATNAKSALTRFQVLQRFERPFSLVRAEPVTGRLHQIRVHLASAGHPIVADEFYGTDRDNVLLARQALHAAQIRLTHPISGHDMEFSAPLAADIQAAIAQLSVIGLSESVVNVIDVREPQPKV